MADRYWVGGNANWNKTSPTGWAASSGGSADESIPTSSDAVFLDNGTGTGNVTVSATANCASLNCTGYIGTLTVNAALNVYGNITLEGTGMTSGGSSVMIGMASGNWTSDGHTWGARLSARGTTQTYTLVDDWTITGAFDTAGSGPTLAGIGRTLNCAGLSVGTTTLAGSATVRLTGGTWSGTSVVTNNMTLAGNVTVSGTVNYGTGTLTRESGTITTTGSTLILLSCTLNTNGVTWATVRTNGNPTYTLNSLLSATTLDCRGDTCNPGTFAGTAGFMVGTLTNSNAVSTAAKTIVLDEGNTYTVTTAMTLAGASDALDWTIQSSAASAAYLVVTPGATLTWVNGTWIDSSGGGTVYTNGTRSNTTNWQETPAGGVMWLS